MDRASRAVDSGSAPAAWCLTCTGTEEVFLHEPHITAADARLESHAAGETPTQKWDTLHLTSNRLERQHLVD
jgi:hypothetical protein